MRKITLISMITLDGVMQAPGAPDEDRSGNFEFGGWLAPYDDMASSKIMQELMKPTDVFLGRITFQIWENYWPQHENGWPGINDVNKYVLSSTVKGSDWRNSIFLGSLEDVTKLKASDGSELRVWGSSKLAQLLLRNDLIDELWILIHPLILGKGKKLFGDGLIPSAFTLLDSTVTSSGVIIANYKRDGEVRTGTVGE